MALRVPVTFQPSGVTCWVDKGATVMEAARAADVMIPATCGGRGLCGSCGVRVADGRLGAPDQVELAGLKRAPEGVRLSCRARVVEPVTLRPVVALRGSALPLEQSHGDLALAVDIGTTNVAVALIDVETGREVGQAVVPNRQSAWGADVLSRISASVTSGDQLTRAVRTSVAEAVDRIGADCSRIVGGVVAANTAMAALFAGIDATSLGSHPFSAPEIPEALDAGTVLDRGFSEGAVLQIVPALGGFVGGDVTAGLIGLGLAQTTSTTLLIDVGTNAEIALVSGEAVYVASAAAGPAFDGVGISSGGPVVDGAIVDVRIVGDGIQANVMGEEDALWFGGSGTVAMVAALLGSGHLAADGRMSSSGALSRHFSVDADGVLKICPIAERPHVCFTQVDVRAIQLAKAAVRTGIDMVLESAGVAPEDLDAVLVAGAFGRALKPEDLVAIGMVPAGAASALSAAGNTSLQGAVAIALDRDLLDVAHALPQRVAKIDLAGAPDFNDRLMAALELEATE